MGLEFKTVTKIAEEGVEEATTSETSKELSLSVRKIEKFSFNPSSSALSTKK